MNRPRKSEPLQEEELLASLAGRIESTLADLLPAGSPVALVGYPNIGNVGDPAVWLGTRRALRRLGARVVYHCEWRAYHRRAMARALDGGTILICGGGNFGDVYTNAQGLRERVIADFPAHRVIQLPQSIWFRDPASVERVKRLVEGHPDFTLMLRDRRALEFARERFDVESILCPDMAFALGPIARPRPPERDILWLARTGPEARGYAYPPDSDRIERVDWLGPSPGDPPRTPATARVIQRNRDLTARMMEDAEFAAGHWREAAATFDALARHRLRRGCHTLARGRVVITDRLHGHVLALLMGIPSVAMDNAYGKVRALYEAWTAPSPIARWAASPAEAIERAGELLKQTEGGPSSSGSS